MARTLVIMPSGFPESMNKPWLLVLRSHDLGGTDYEAVARLDDDHAAEIVAISNITWLYGEPDWDERARKRKLERARVLREEAEKIEKENQR